MAAVAGDARVFDEVPLELGVESFPELFVLNGNELFSFLATLDSHNVQRFVTEEGFVQNEGDIGVRTPRPYQISYGSIVPKKSECTNLLVPVCVSSSHIAFGSIRMEPVFMILGQSAATAACIAIEDDLAVQDVPYDKLKSQLIADGQVLEMKKK